MGPKSPDEAPRAALLRGLGIITLSCILAACHSPSNGSDAGGGDAGGGDAGGGDADATGGRLDGGREVPTGYEAHPECIGICADRGVGTTGVGGTRALLPAPSSGEGLDGGTAHPAPEYPLQMHRQGWNLTEENSSGVVVEEGALTLNQQLIQTDAVWIANDVEGTVSRLDKDTGDEIGRYPSIMTGRDIMHNNASRASPSRTAIDLRGDCWVANRYRHTNEPGSVTKIASSIKDCVDRDGSGTIETSRDLNGDGSISLDPSEGEYLGGDDECVLFTVTLGTGKSIPRALAIAPDPTGNSPGGNAWVGLNYGDWNTANSPRRALELDGTTGAVLREVPMDINPYGALASKFQGRVWFTNASWQDGLPSNPPAIQSIELSTGRISPRYDVQNPTGECVGTYGITVDADGNVWVSGHDCSFAFRFDPTDESWTSVRLSQQGKSRGLVADGEGHIWVAHSGNCGRDNCGVVTRFDGNDPNDMEEYHLPAGQGSIGVDLDSNGRVWVVNRGSSTAARIDPATNTIEEFATGNGPYTYSDFTGYSLRLHFSDGRYRTVLRGDCENAVWHGITPDALVPDNTTVSFRIRTADSAEDLEQSLWAGPWTGATSLLDQEGDAHQGQYAEVEILLASGRADRRAPQVFGLDVLYSCPLL